MIETVMNEINNTTINSLWTGPISGDGSLAIGAVVSSLAPPLTSWAVYIDSFAAIARS